ncbi:MAG: hypothetical protein ABJC26_05195 [Gemmatimonadaceae bacterium]
MDSATNSLARISQPPCSVKEDGSIECPPVGHPSPHTVLDALYISLQSAQPPVTFGPYKRQLLSDILDVLLQSTLEDKHIPTRSDEIVGTVTSLLFDISAGPPSSVRLFHYSKLPAFIMGSFLANRGDFDSVKQVYDEFADPKPWQL